MRKIVLFIADSLDGYIARKDDSIDWLFTDGDYGYNEFISSVDTMLMGRKTYDIAVQLGDTSYEHKKWFVFSKSSIGKNKYAEFVNSDIVNFTKELLKQRGKNIWLVGGGEIVKIFLENKLIDEIIISIHPVILGEGIPLFIPPAIQTELVLRNSISYQNGLTQLFYEIKK